MASWLPVLKAALPYIGNIVAEAVPVFTSRKEQDASADLVSRQISELQEAVTSNAEAVKVLAAQVEKTIAALDAGEDDLAQRMAALQETLAHCDSSANLAQAQVTRLEGVAAAIQIRADNFDQLLVKHHRHERVIAAIALFALLIAGIALLR